MSDNFRERLIRDKAAADNFKVRLHALLRSNERGIMPAEIKTALLNAVIVEDYPDDPRGHSCLVWGRTSSGRDLHLVCGITDDMLWIVTVYEPNPEAWETPERRRPK